MDKILDLVIKIPNLGNDNNSFLHNNPHIVDDLEEIVRLHSTNSRVMELLPELVLLTRMGDIDWEFGSQLIKNTIVSNLKFDILKSFKSPMNIDLTAINQNTPEGARFNQVYNALRNVPEFKALFTDIFAGPQTRLNVKFEIHEHVYHNNDPNSYEVAANIDLTDNPNDNNYTIKVNKQTLDPNSSLYQNKLENAQAIAHEAIHAFLHNLLKNPNTIASISNIDQKDLKDLLQALQVANSNQHNIMFNKLTTKLAIILKSLKDILTTPAQRAMVEDLMINQSATAPHNPMLWDWNTYFTYLSFLGLDGTPGFIALFPPGSNALHNFNLYISYGRAFLNI